MKAAHTVLYIHEEAHTNVRFISCDGHQLYERGVDLEVEGVRYIEMPLKYWARLLQGAEISNQKAESMHATSIRIRVRRLPRAMYRVMVS